VRDLDRAFKLADAHRAVDVRGGEFDAARERQSHLLARAAAAGEPAQEVAAVVPLAADDERLGRALDRDRAVFERLRAVGGAYDVDFGRVCVARPNLDLAVDGADLDARPGVEPEGLPRLLARGRAARRDRPVHPAPGQGRDGDEQDGDEDSDFH
jgi:hypothetical protein